jgi:hypothetical protein
MSYPCAEHKRYSCWDPTCQQKAITNNAGAVSVTTEGDLAIGIGSGLTIDSDGDLGMQIAPGISIDLSGGDN